MSFERHNREKHCDLLKTRLETLTGRSFTGNHSSLSLQLFDDYLGYREFGLASDTLCNFHLETDIRPVGRSEVEQIAELYAPMDARDDRILKLKEKCTE